jgi:dephospho-CoA kinase
LASYLRDERGFIHLSFRDFLIERLDELGLEFKRENMRMLANKLRKEHGADYVLEQMFKRADDLKKDVVIESIRTLNEVSYLKHKGAIILATTAPAEIRYERIYKRQSETDNISYQEFLEDEKKESQSSDPDIQNLPQVVAQADYVIQNVDLNSFKRDIDSFLEEIKKDL